MVGRIFTQGTYSGVSVWPAVSMPVGLGIAFGCFAGEQQSPLAAT